MIASFGLFVLYYGGSEALWARTAGKALLGLTLVDAAGRPPRPAVAFARALLFAGPNILLGLGVLTIWGGGLAAQTQNAGRINAFTMIGQLLILVTLFAAARRRNGYAALHDLATGVRVVERRRLDRERSAGDGTGTAARRRARRRASRIVRRARRHDRGPARVAAGPRRAAAATGVDPRRPDRHAAVAAARVALPRPTRLRWLAGRRTAQEAWDVYEGVAGVPIAQACRSPRSWSEVRRWLADLARELAAQQPGDHPPLDLDRVWILDSGRAKLLDDPTADAPTPRRADWLDADRPADRGRASGARRRPPAVAGRRHRGSPTRLSEAPPASLSEVARRPRTRCCEAGPAVTRGWRILSLAALVAIPHADGRRWSSAAC